LNDTASQKLKEIIDQYGQSVCDDARRCEGLLKDYCPECRLEINSLISVLKEGIPQELIRSAPVFPLEVTVPKLVKQTVENLGLTEENARWSVETWASALGVTAGRPADKTPLKPETREVDVSRETLILPAATPAAKQVKRRLNSANLKRYTVQDTLQYPATVVSIAIFVLSMGYLLLLASTFGMKLAAIVLIVISGMTAAVTFYLRYPKEYAEKSRQITEELIAEREQKESVELFSQEETLQTGFMNVYSPEGAKALDAMSKEFRQWVTALDQHKSIDPLAASALRSAGGETLRTGLNILSDAFDLMKLVQMTGTTRLENEILATEREIAHLRNEPDRTEHINFKQQVLSSLKDRLNALSQIQLCIEQLIHQAGRCEGVLRAARVELAGFRDNNTHKSLDSVITTLQECQVQVKEAQTSLMQKAGKFLQEGQKQPGAVDIKD
jgi:hypothetical protein